MSHVDEARNARDALLDSGFDASEVRLQSNPAAQESDTLTTTGRTITGTSRSTEDEGFMASIGRFGAYEDYEPAYQYGSSLRADPRYASRSWDEVEADARNDWAQRYPTGASTWEQTRQAVRHGWESMTGRR